MKITKMHGAGNDFILINNFTQQLGEDVLPELARSLCSRRLSVGADGLILADKPLAEGDIRMVFYNSDGSRAEMCGNGARCLARFAYEQGLVNQEMTIETLAGPVEAKRIDDTNYWIRLPNPSLIEKTALDYENSEIESHYVELGNPGVPHLCVELNDLATISQAKLYKMGHYLRNHPDLPHGANVNFYQSLDRGHYLEKTFERGVEDFTMACGTGSAAVALAVQTDQPDLRHAKIHFTVPGGELFIESRWLNETVLSVDLIGPTEVVFVAELNEIDCELET